MGPRPSGAARQGAFGATVTFIVLFVVDFLLKGGHFSAFDLKTLCMNALPLVLVALGQFFVVLTNGIDLSLGPMMSVSGAIAALDLFDKSHRRGAPCDGRGGRRRFGKRDPRREATTAPNSGDARDHVDFPGRRTCDPAESRGHRARRPHGLSDEWRPGTPPSAFGPACLRRTGDWLDDDDPLRNLASRSGRGRGRGQIPAVSRSRPSSSGPMCLRPCWLGWVASTWPSRPRTGRLRSATALSSCRLRPSCWAELRSSVGAVRRSASSWEP